MDSSLVQRTRYVLHSRVRRAQKCNLYLFESACRSLLSWIDNHPALGPTMAHLEGLEAALQTELEEMLEKARSEDNLTDTELAFNPTTADHFAAVAAHVVRAASQCDLLPKNKGNQVLQKLYRLLTNGHSYQTADYVEAVRDVAIDGLYEYLDEQLDARNAVWGIIQKYKQRSEWFGRARLRAVADTGMEGLTGERGLALNLQEYVLDQGAEFYVEPTSASGEVDLLLRDPEGRHLIIDAKYVAADESRAQVIRKLRDGFHQVYRYCQDLNEPSGFLVAFYRNTTRVFLDLEESDGLNSLGIGGKRIYFQDIHISEEPSASRSGKAEEFRITRDELVLLPLKQFSILRDDSHHSVSSHAYDQVHASRHPRRRSPSIDHVFALSCS